MMHKKEMLSPAKNFFVIHNWEVKELPFNCIETWFEGVETEIDYVFRNEKGDEEYSYFEEQVYNTKEAAELELRRALKDARRFQREQW